MRILTSQVNYKAPGVLCLHVPPTRGVITSDFMAGYEVGVWLGKSPML